MTRAGHHPDRLTAIDARTRARRVAGLRQRQIFARQPEAQRRARLAWLAQLAGAIDAGNFTPAELMDAAAALGERNPKQQRLDLGTSQRART